jgi:hypothetical protein
VDAVVLGILEFWSGLLSNRWCATLNPSGGRPIQKFTNPLQNTQKPTTEDNYNLYTQTAIVRKKKLKKFVKVGECEGWG